MQIFTFECGSRLELTHMLILIFLKIRIKVLKYAFCYFTKLLFMSVSEQKATLKMSPNESKIGY